MEIAKDFELPKDSWVESLSNYLPVEINGIIQRGYSNSFTEDEAIKTAYNLMNSTFSSKIKLPPEHKIPNVYYSNDYVYREKFSQLNNSNNNALSENDLIQAMFLHRGLYLQAYASSNHLVYMPYHYRGKMLANISPAIVMPAPDDGFRIAQLPSRQEKLSLVDNYQKQLNIFYYELLEKFSWTKYSVDFSFIGLAIFQSASLNPSKALDLALYYRSQNDFASFWGKLTSSIENNDKIEAERILETFKKQLISAARYMGAKIENPNSAPVLKLITSLVPYANIIDPILKLLPDFAKEWGENIINNFIRNTPLQSLFIQHIKSTNLQVLS